MKITALLITFPRVSILLPIILAIVFVIIILVGWTIYKMLIGKYFCDSLTFTAFREMKETDFIYKRSLRNLC